MTYCTCPLLPNVFAPSLCVDASSCSPSPLPEPLGGGGVNAGPAVGGAGGGGGGGHHLHCHARCHSSSAGQDGSIIDMGQGEEDGDGENEAPMATMVLPSHVLASLQRQSSLRAKREREAAERGASQRQQNILKRIIPCVKTSPTFDDFGDDNSSDDSRFVLHTYVQHLF